MYTLSKQDHMSTYIQEQHNVLNFWTGLHKNALALRIKIDSLYKIKIDLTESESEIYCSIFQHRHSLVRITENQEKLILQTRTDRPTFEFICKARQRFINTIYCILNKLQTSNQTSSHHVAMIINSQHSKKI